MAALVGSFGTLVLIGWGAGIPFLKSMRPGYPTMQANTALALLAASVALWLANEHGGHGRAALETLLAGVAAAIGGLTLLEYATGWNLHIDELLVRDAGSLIAGSPGRMAAVAALSLLLLGGALVVLLHRRLAVLAQLCALLTGAFCLLSLNCYLFGIHEFPGVAVYAALSIHTSGSLLLLSLGVLFCCADCGPMESISSRAPGGIMAMRLLPGVLLVPSVLGWVRWQGQLHGLYDSAFGLALFASANAVFFAFLIWTTAAVLNRLDLGRLRAEAEIRSFNQKLETAAAEAQSANRAKSTFLSTMSHEIRTPLNAVLGYTQLMLRDPGLSKDTKQNLSIIGRSGEHLMNLINDVMDMSKIEAGRTELTPVTFSLSTLLDHLVAMFRLRAEAKGVRFELSADVKAAGYVVADEGKIRQVLINLVGNAIKFTALGKIQLHVSLADKGGQLWLVACVQDTGPGISAEDQAKLFEPFMQAKGELNTQKGTGLGLAISRKYARLMEGDITATSLPGEGSLFLFEIPVQSGDATAVVRTQAPRRVIGLRSGSETPEILVVDDQPENRDSLMKLLNYVGFSVRGAGSGEEALRMMEERRPRMILMDVHMPGIDGLETTRRIKASSSGKDTLIVALTASAMEDDRRMVAASGADDFLAKPCPENELFEMLRVLLNVTYDYEESTVAENQGTLAEAISAEQLMPIPSQWMEELLDATVEGKKKEMDAVLLKVRETYDASLATRLQDLADRYEYDTLTRILEERVAKEKAIDRAT